MSHSLAAAPAMTQGAPLVRFGNREAVEPSAIAENES
jgi:hypothetical protein